MSSYPAFVHLIRLLGREPALAALGATSEPDPARLSAEQRQTLAGLVDGAIDNVAAQLVSEAAASDDVRSVSDARAFIRDRIAGFGDLLDHRQSERVLALADATTMRWDQT
jgi:hypothetical protein